MEAFALTKENAQAFYPLLPEEFRRPEPSEDTLLLGVTERDDAGVDHACGAMVLQLASDELLLLNWLLVATDHQRRGAGSALLELACDIAVRLELQLVCVFSERPETGQGGAVYRFFQKHGFAVEEREAKDYSILVGELGKEAFFQKKQKNGAGVLTLAETPENLIAALNRTLAEQNHLLDGPISKDGPVSDVSLVKTENGAITACVIFRELGEHVVELSFAYSGKKASMQIPLLLLRAQQLLRRQYAPETELVIPCVTEASRKLVEALAPSAAVARVSYGAYWSPKGTAE